MKKETWITVIICSIFLLGAGMFYLKSSSGDTGQPSLQWSNDTTQIPNASVFSGTTEGSDRASSSCTVYICGAVKQPGVYHFSVNARVCDAVEAAGGFTKKAVTDSVNQARILTDGEQITIPVKSNKSNGNQDSKSENKDTSSEDGRVNINQAGKEELMTLSGIGEVKAQMIIDYRNEHGQFARIEDIMKISGIKEGVYNQIKDNITI